MLLDLFCILVGSSSHTYLVSTENLSVDNVKIRAALIPDFTETSSTKYKCLIKLNFVFFTLA